MRSAPPASRMPRTIQLLKQIRGTLEKIGTDSTNPEHASMLAAAQCALNELMHREEPAFYLEHLERGKRILAEGMGLAGRGRSVASAAPDGPDALPERSSFQAVYSAIQQLQAQLVKVVVRLDESDSAQNKAYLDRVSDWEASLYRHSSEESVPRAASKRKEIAPQAVLAYLRRRFPQWQGLSITHFAALPGGFSKKTILFETHDDLHGAQAMVIRAEQPAEFLGFDGCDVAREFKSIQLIRAKGLQVAEPLWLEEGENELGTRFLVSRKVLGKTFGDTLGAKDGISPQLLDSILSTLIRMHSIAVDRTDPLARGSHLEEWFQFATVTEATRHAVIELLPRRLRRSGTRVTPSLQRALGWLEQNVPECDDPPTIIHIDFALNNLIVADDRVAAVLDWESSRTGDPAEDILWTQQNLAAYIDMPEFLRRYNAGTGREISPYRLAYSRVFRSAGSLVSCLNAMNALETNDEAHVTLSILAYKYLPLFGAQLHKLIADAEHVRRTTVQARSTPSMQSLHSH